MTDDVADVLERPAGRSDEAELVATGGTLFGNPLSMAAARATMGEVLTADAYAHTHALGARLADGIEKSIARGRPAVDHAPVLAALGRHVRARDAAQRAPRPYATKDVELIVDSRASTSRTAGVWEAIVGAGPTCSVPATEEDVDRYVDAYGVAPARARRRSARAASSR